jgi:hypothetical protein
LLSALSVFLLKSILYGAFVWARRALNGPKRRFPARAGEGIEIDSRHCQTTRNSFHWEAFFFPLRAAIALPSLDEALAAREEQGGDVIYGAAGGGPPLRFGVRRCCEVAEAPADDGGCAAAAGVGRHRLWYEWGSREEENWQNVDGSMQALWLQTPEDSEAHRGDPPPLDTPVSDPGAAVG